MQDPTGKDHSLFAHLFYQLLVFSIHLNPFDEMKIVLCFPECHRNFHGSTGKTTHQSSQSNVFLPYLQVNLKMIVCQNMRVLGSILWFCVLFCSARKIVVSVGCLVDGFQNMPAWRNGYFTKHQTGVIISHFWGDQTIHHCFVRISPSTLHYSGNVRTPVKVKRKQHRFLRISVLVILLAASSCHQQTATGWCHSDRIRCGDSWWFQRLLFTRKICGRFPGWWCSYAFRLVVQPGMRVPRTLGDSQTIGFLDNEPFL